MKHKFTILTIALLVLIASTGGFYFYQSIEGEKTVYLPLDEFLVDVIVPQNQGENSFLKIKLTLEIEHKRDLNKIEEQMPKIRDIINYYARDLRFNDLIGSGSIYYLRQEILLRINKILFPAKIKNVLFNEIVRG